jgi:hypothetical protein
VFFTLNGAFIGVAARVSQAPRAAVGLFSYNEQVWRMIARSCVRAVTCRPPRSPSTLARRRLRLRLPPNR